MDDLQKLAKNKTVWIAGAAVALLLGFSFAASFFLNPSQIKITQESEDGPKVGVIDEDGSSASDALLNDILGGLRGRVFNSKSVASLKDALAAKKIDIGIHILSGFGAGFAGGQTTITVYYDPTNTTSSEVNHAVQQVIQNYGQQNGGTIVVQAVIVTPPDNPSGSGAGGSSGTGQSSTGENPTNKPRRVP